MMGRRTRGRDTESTSYGGRLELGRKGKKEEPQAASDARRSWKKSPAMGEGKK